MNLTLGNKNVIVGLLVFLVYLSMTFFIERTGSMHAFHEKAAQAVVDTKGSANLTDHQVVDIKRGPAYRTGGIYFKNYYPDSYLRVWNSFRDAGYNMRLYAWMFALFNIVIGVIIGVQTRAGRRMRACASWLGLIGVVLYPIRDAVYFWGRWLNPSFSPAGSGPFLYPILWIGASAMFVAALLTLIVFVKGARQ
jgi:hypothetical protein